MTTPRRPRDTAAASAPASPHTTTPNPAVTPVTAFGWIVKNWLVLTLMIIVVGAAVIWSKGQKNAIASTPAPTVSMTAQEFELKLAAAKAEAEVKTKAETLAEAANAAKMAELEHKLAAKEAEEQARIEARKNLKPIDNGGMGTEVLLTTDGDMLKDIFLGWDSKSVPGYRVPLIKNTRGNPSPIVKGPQPFPLAPVGTAWVKVKYVIPSGKVYDAWATKDGPSS